jgi:hypothetical protein
MRGDERLQDGMFSYVISRLEGNKRAPEDARLLLEVLLDGIAPS